MGRPRAQINFKRYGIGALIVALVMGLWLSLDFIDCTGRGLAGMDLGELSDLKRFDKNQDRRGTYLESAGDGVGFMEKMVYVPPKCAERSDFRDPHYAWMGFRIAGGLGLFLMLLNLIFRPKWKKEIKKRGQQSERPGPDRRTAQKPPPEKIDLD